MTRHIRRSHLPAENNGEKKYHMNTRATENKQKLVSMTLSITSDDEEEEEEEIHDNVMYDTKRTSSSVVHPNYWLNPQCYNYITSPTLYEPTNYYPSVYYPQE